MARSGFARALGRCLGIAGYVVQYGCIAHCTLEFVGDFVVCRGPSMEPTIHSEDILLTEHITPRLNRIQRGDIVIARSPTNPHHHICKRVAAVQGDKIRQDFRAQIVPRGHVWLEGDNSHNSTDSRTFGPVPAGLIRGRALLRLWPLDHVGRLDAKRREEDASQPAVRAAA